MIVTRRLREMPTLAKRCSRLDGLGEATDAGADGDAGALALLLARACARELNVHAS